eukprot:759870-Hanusia_phi.AAC.2
MKEVRRSGAMSLELQGSSHKLAPPVPHEDQHFEVAVDITPCQGGRLKKNVGGGSDSSRRIKRQDLFYSHLRELVHARVGHFRGGEICRVGSVCVGQEEGIRGVMTWWKGGGTDHPCLEDGGHKTITLG